ALNSGKTDEDRGDFIRARKKAGCGDVAQIVEGLEIAVGGRSARMDDPLGNALVVKMGDFFAQDDIFK
ncbi:hypothetical protein XU19_23690, partial [Vibrio parahaemolyticus]